MIHITRVLLLRVTRLSNCLCHIRVNKRLAALINSIAVLLDGWIHEMHDTHHYPHPFKCAHVLGCLLPVRAVGMR